LPDLPLPDPLLPDLPEDDESHEPHELEEQGFPQSPLELPDPLFPDLPDPDPLLPDLPEPDPLPHQSSLELEDPQPKRRVSSVRRRPDLPLLPEDELEHGLPMKIEHNMV